MIEILINFFSCLTINILFMNRLYLRSNQKCAVIKSIFISVILSLVTAYVNSFNIPFFNLLATLLSFMILKVLIFKLNITEKIREDFMDFMVLVFLDSLCFFLTGFIYTDEVMYFRSLSSTIVVIFLSTVLFNYFRPTRYEKVPKHEIILFFSITAFSIVLIYIFSLLYSYGNGEHKIIIIFIILGLISLNLIVFHYLEFVNKNYELKERILLEEIEVKMTNQHYSDMKDQYLNTRKLIHDFKNHLCSIDIALKTNKKELAHKIIAQYIKECDDIKINLITGSDILDIILNDKISKADKLRIDFQFEMQPEINMEWIKEFDMITIFGNVLDNAIEANVAENIKHKYIKLKIYQKHEMLIIKQSNSCDNELKRNHNSYITTKKGHSGVGVQNLRKVVELYDGLYDINIDNNHCDVLICLTKPTNMK